MQYHWIQRKGSKNLLLFFCGWGSDFRPFEIIPSHNFDIICFYSYHIGNLPDWDEILAPYTTQYVVAWSMGVLQAEIALSNRSSAFTRAIAVNGTLLPVDDRFGIPCSSYQQTIDSFSEPSLRKFIQRMCKDRSVIATYSNQLPIREIQEQKDELQYHQQQSMVFSKQNTLLFSKAIIGMSDLIFPPSNMQKFWEGKVPIFETEFPHFPFYQFPSWDALLNS